MALGEEKVSGRVVAWLAWTFISPWGQTQVEIPLDVVMLRP